MTNDGKSCGTTLTTRNLKQYNAKKLRHPYIDKVCESKLLHLRKLTALHLMQSVFELLYYAPLALKSKLALIQAKARS